MIDHVHDETSHSHPTVPEERSSIQELGDPHAIERTADVFKALATPSRLRILLVLSHGPSSVNNIVTTTHLSQPLVSQHLKMLRGMHLVSVHREGREAIYSLKDDHVAHIILDALAHSAEVESV